MHVGTAFFLTCTFIVRYIRQHVDTFVHTKFLECSIIFQIVLLRNDVNIYTVELFSGNNCKMNDMSITPYMNCIEKKCGSVDSAVSFAKTGKEILLEIGKKKVLDADDVKKVKYFATRIRKHKVNIDDAKCALEKCGKEYAKMSEKSLKMLADEMDKIASILEKHMSKTTETKKTSPKKMSVKKTSAKKTSTKK